MKVDPYKKFDLIKPTAGLIYEITSPKGIRKQGKNGYMYYELHTGASYLYDDAPIELSDGVYWVMDVCKIKDAMTWNHFLFIIEGDNITPVGEFLNITNTTWVVDAVPIIKATMSGDITPIDITLHPPKPSKKQGSTKFAK